MINMTIGVVEFSNGGYKIRKIFASESKYSKKIIEFWEFLINGKLSKFDFQKQFSMSIIIQIFFNSFSMKNTNLGAHFFVIDIFCYNQSINYFITKMMPYFGQIDIKPKLKIQ